MNHSLAHFGAVIFDFDGPICSVFAGLPAPTVADNLRELARNHGADITTINKQDDPMEILRWSGDQDARMLKLVEDALVNEETKAVAAARPTPGAHDLIRRLHKVGIRIGIASNNASNAIRAYLNLHHLTAYVDAVAGRRLYAPHTMKPNTSCLEDCLSQLSATADKSVYVGDMLGDVEAANRLRMPVIAFANEPGKAEQFTQAGAKTIISDLAELAAAAR